MKKKVRIKDLERRNIAHTKELMINKDTEKKIRKCAVGMCGILEKKGIIKIWFSEGENVDEYVIHYLKNVLQRDLSVERRECVFLR